jgi:hypothetical protein
MDLPRDKAESLATEFKRLSNQHHVTASLKFIPRESALENLNKQADLTDVVSTLGANPLPDAYVVKLTGSTSEARVKQVQDLATALEKVEGVAVRSSQTLYCNDFEIPRLKKGLKKYDTFRVSELKPHPNSTPFEYQGAMCAYFLESDIDSKTNNLMQWEIVGCVIRNEWTVVDKF